VAPVPLGARVQAVAATPSGDRLYVATERAGEIVVVDRYAERVTARLALPGDVRELRMDPIGRYLLARAEPGDSAYVVALGTDAVQGVVHGAWRDDLPLVMPDGAIATVQGDDVAFVDAATLGGAARGRPTQTVAGGAADLWHLVIWNGFRPRATELDQPVTFESATRPTRHRPTTRWRRTAPWPRRISGPRRLPRPHRATAVARLRRRRARPCLRRRRVTTAAAPRRVPRSPSPCGATPRRRHARRRAPTPVAPTRCGGPPRRRCRAGAASPCSTPRRTPRPTRAACCGGCA
jgi:hypothetical protein